MKKQIRFFTILMITVFNISSFVTIVHFPLVNATYVEGVITQNTSWKLVDSPYVLFNDVLILPNVTLAIEPNVEVRFGGDFSLIVMGTLIANGTADKMIKFTSNKHIPAAGDWATIMFLGAQQSTLAYCIIEYGTNGTTVQGGNLNVQKSLVRFNSYNGIRIENGHVEAKNNDIMNNTLNGVCISGTNQALIQNNTIKQNGNAIALTGGTASGIDIERNEISSNSQSGIVLQANTLVNIDILNNLLSTNHYGFYILSDSSTYITRNYVINNTVGIYYQNGFGHQAHFNDIYGNSLGMDVASQQSPELLVVNATHNYWGDRTGPNHASLNPYGRGDHVGGDGVNLKFIFFLTAPTDYGNVPPTARLWSDKILAAPKQTVTFVGTDSYDDGRVDQYFFDFGDGKTSGWTTLSIVDHNYSSVGNYDVRLKVMDDFEVQSYNNALTTISIQNLTPLQASTVLNQQIVYYNENVSVTVQVADATGPVQDATVTLLPVGGGIAAPQIGSTNSTGYFTAAFTAPNVTEITNVRIIARASKTGYADGSAYDYLKVLPPLTVQVLPMSDIVKSEQALIVTVQVTSGLEPIMNASVTLALAPNIGNLSTTTGITDINGNMTTVFTAPQTLSRTTVTIGATATGMGFAVGQNQKTITIEPRSLNVQVSANPSVITSEAVSSITVHTTSDGAPTSNAFIQVSSDAGGFSTSQGDTNANGDITFTFTAPQITTPMNTTITAIATKNGYISGQAQTVITIHLKMLTAQVTATPMTTVSESRVNITVFAVYGISSVSDVNITVYSNSGGNFDRNWTLTDSNGYATLAFTTPPVNAETNLSLTVRASKRGYVDAENQLDITVNPGTLSLNVIASPTITSGQTTVISVIVTCNTTQTTRNIANASVTVTATDGNFLIGNAPTDSNGYCNFTFASPTTTEPISITITTNATKYGYTSTENQTTLVVNPIPPSEAGGGWTLLTILLIIVPIVVVAVVIVVLIKRRIIKFSVEGEEN